MRSPQELNEKSICLLHRYSRLVWWMFTSTQKFPIKVANSEFDIPNFEDKDSWVWFYSNFRRRPQTSDVFGTICYFFSSNSTFSMQSIYLH